jgi:nicotinamide-nucleotide amidase
VGESDLEAMLPDLIARDRYPLVGITVHQATITLRITAEGETADAARAAMGPTIETIRGCLGDLIFGEEDEELEHIVLRLLGEQKKTLLVDEWATRGLVSTWLAEFDSRGVFRSGRIHNDSESWAGGAMDGADADIRLLVGPASQPDSAEAKAGSYEVVLSERDRTFRRSFPFAGHPEILRPRAAKQALNLLRLHLMGKE